MIAQIMLSAGLSACLFYVFSLGRSLPIVRLGLFAVVLVGYIFIWFPGLTTRIATLVGIGRGADLILYIWIVVNLFLILRLHIKLREQSEAFTKLARQFALLGVGEAHDTPSTMLPKKE